MVFVVFVASTTNLDSLLDHYDVKMPHHLRLSVHLLYWQVSDFIDFDSLRFS